MKETRSRELRHINLAKDFHGYMQFLLNEIFDITHEIDIMKRSWDMGKDLPKANRKEEKKSKKEYRKIDKMYDKVSQEYLNLVKLSIDFLDANGEGFDQEQILKRLKDLKMDANVLKAYLPYVVAKIKLKERDSEKE